MVIGQIILVIKVSWLFVYHQDDISYNEWSLPKGFEGALRDLNVDVIKYTFKNPNNFKLPEKKFFLENNIKVLLSFYAGKSEILENELIRVKKEVPIVLISELGDEPQTLIHNKIRARISDISLTPDKRSSIYWNNQGCYCLWFNHWADTNIFKFMPEKKRTNFIVTTMGKRKYSLLLKLLLGRNFLNVRCKAEKNSDLFNSGKIVFQYARWDEITRRIFEAGACKCCILTNKLPSHTGVETIFAHNVSAIYYKGFFDLIYQVFRLWFKPELIKEIANNSYEIVMSNHTQLERAKFLVKKVNELKSKK